tara:strand:+ start:91 stop:576 length:486 start_codon:yes stop_codon:yes gene_type:complete
MAHTQASPTERRALVAELIANGKWTGPNIARLAKELNCSERTLYSDRKSLQRPSPPRSAAPVVQLAPPPRPAVASIDLSSASLLDVYGWLLQRLAGELEAGDMRDTARVAAYREIRSVAVDLHDLRNAERPDEVSTSAEELEARMSALVSRLPASLRRSIG